MLINSGARQCFPANNYTTNSHVYIKRMDIIESTLKTSGSSSVQIVRQGNSEQREMRSLQEVGNNYIPDPLMIQLDQLRNQLRDTEKELGAASCEIKAMKQTESLKDRALLELTDELKRVDEKLRTVEKHLESKNLEIKQLSNEKKEALAGQFAAEATLRRVHATQEDEEFFPIEAIIAPLQSEIKKYKNEISRLQEDKKALQRLTKSKEAALIEAEKILHSALERVLIVENVQNRNLELRRQVEICQDENRYLNKIHRHKVVEVEKLTQTVHELKESALVHGATTNAIRDYQRQISELNEAKRTLEMELAKARVSVNRVAAVVANEWKDENNRVMPVKQWLEDKKCFQEEIRRLREKLAISERTAKAEAQLKERLQLRLSTLEEGLKQASGLSSMQAISSEQGSHNPEPRKKSTVQARTSFPCNKASILQQNNLKTVKILATKDLSTPRNQSSDYNGKGNASLQVESSELVDDVTPREMKASEAINAKRCADADSQVKSGQEEGCNDTVSGFLYDRLQKEVIKLRKSLKQKDGLLKAQDDETKKLHEKLEARTKTMERQCKTKRRSNG